jgi:hypothetical protein
MSQRSAMEVAEAQGEYDRYCARLNDREDDEVAGWNPQTETLDDYFDRVEFRLVDRRREARAEADKLRREGLELVKALEIVRDEISDVKVRDVIDRALAKWGAA